MEQVNTNQKSKKLNWILKIVNMLLEEEKIYCESLGKKRFGKYSRQWS